MLDHDECKEHLKRIHELREAKKELEEEKKRINAELDERIELCADYFENSDEPKMAIAGLGTFTPTASVYPRIVDDKAIEWLKERGEFEMLMSFNTNKFKSYYKELLETGEETPPGVETYVKRNIKCIK